MGGETKIFSLKLDLNRAHTFKNVFGIGRMQFIQITNFEQFVEILWNCFHMIIKLTNYLFMFLFLLGLDPEHADVIGKAQRLLHFASGYIYSAFRSG